MGEDIEEIISELSKWDFPDKTMEPDGYDMKTVPESTKANFLVLMDKINEIVRHINGGTNRQ